MRVVQRVLIATVVCSAAMLPTVPAAGRGDELAAAKERVAEARAAANDIAAKVTETYGQVQLLGDEIIAVEARIADGNARADDLRASVRRRALNAYTGSGEQAGVLLLEDDDPGDLARRTQYLDRVNARDNAAVSELHALKEDLEHQRGNLDETKKAQESALAQLKDEQAKLDGLLAEAQAAQTALEERLARESAARQAAEEAARRAKAAPSGSGPSSGSGSGQVVGGLTCPVPGAAFSDSWGDPRSGGRSHQGTDLMAPYGTPNYAVIGGTVSTTSSGGGGLHLVLSGSDGNTYLYLHLESYVVSGGSVSQGQLVALTGDSGNATGVPHTHFEIHLGGSPINPYPTLASIC
ncbi:MAG TPA: peptidoglycan DD-metalloendopeptidase family protein [Acidimicrobiia bacterium]|nr:peptidoglycan DD-metalloendopeptidase family protein [Acidimicrobiia bacterium]